MEQVSSKQKVLALFPEAFAFEHGGIWYIGPKPAYVRTLRTVGGQKTESAAWDDALPDAEKCAERREARRVQALSGEKGKDAQVSALLASLAQSEAERERLQNKVAYYELTCKMLESEVAEMTKDRDLWQEAHNDDCPNKAMADSLLADLARERELNQGLRSLLVESMPHLDYKRTHAQTAPSMKAVANLMARIRVALAPPTDPKPNAEEAGK